jgi:hypothetical protein
MALKAKEASAGSTVNLELAFSKRYNRMGELFEAGKVYRFSAEQAVKLLEEEDNGKRIWRVVRAISPVLSPALQQAAAVIDRTDRPVAAVPENDDPTAPAKNKIEIGNDEEIESILNTGDVVTV